MTDMQILALLFMAGCITGGIYQISKTLDKIYEIMKNRADEQ